MSGRDEARAAPDTTAAGRRMGHWGRYPKAFPLLAALALGLAVTACDRCGDFDWRGHACHTHPAQN